MVETVVAAGLEGRVHRRAGLRRDPVVARTSPDVARAARLSLFDR